MRWDEFANIREGKGLSMSDLSSLCGIPAATLHGWEADTPTTITRLRSICDALDVTPNELLGYSICEADRTKDGTTVIKHQQQFDVAQLAAISDAIDMSINAIKSKIASSDSRIDESDVKFHNRLLDIKDAISSSFAQDVKSDNCANIMKATDIPMSEKLKQLF